MFPIMRSAEELIYSVEPLKPSKRSKQMQVLALGLSRSGTDSLCKGLQILGYDHVYHGYDVGGGDASVRKRWSDLGRRKWGPGGDANPVTVEDFDQILGHCEAVTDQPCACFALELIEAYPEAKVVLNRREVDSWYRSVEATFGAHFASWQFRWLYHFDTALYWLKQDFMLYEKGYFQGSMLRNAKRVHKEHYAMIRGVVPKDRLLEWTVEDGWEPLCNFLGRPIPETDFPKGNNPAQTHERAAKITAAAKRRAYRNLGFAVAFGIALVSGGAFAVLSR